jgi:hypothetical protein
MSTEIATRNSYAAAPMDERVRYSQVIAGAGNLLPRSVMLGAQADAARVFLVFEMADMLGIHPLAGLTGVHVIEGKPSLSAGLMSGLVRNAGHVLRVETKGSVKAGTFEATATLVRSDDPGHPFVVTWDLDRAQRAELAGKAMWKKYFEAMAKARAISEVCREGAEDVLMGAHYTPEELGAEVNEEGEPINLGEVPSTPSKPRQTRKPATRKAEPTPEPEQSPNETTVEPEPEEPQAEAQPPAPAPEAAQPVHAQAAPIVTAQSATGRDWRAELDATANTTQLTEVFTACREAGQLGQMTEHNGRQIMLREYIRIMGTAMNQQELDRQRAAEQSQNDLNPVVDGDDNEPMIFTPTGEDAPMHNPQTGEVA